MVKFEGCSNLERVTQYLQPLDMSGDSKYAEHPQREQHIQELEVVAGEETHEHQDASHACDDVHDVEKILEIGILFLVPHG